MMIEKITDGLPNGFEIHMDAYDPHPRRFSLVLNGQIVAGGLEFTRRDYESIGSAIDFSIDYIAAHEYKNFIEEIMKKFRVAQEEKRKLERLAFHKMVDDMRMAQREQARIALSAVVKESGE